MNVVIVDYGMGNLRSVYNKFRRLAVDCSISANPADIERADALVLPGVGHYGKAMDKLRSLDLIRLLNERVLDAHVPVMGICLGMQLLMESSEEGDSEGLGWIKGDTVRFQLDESPKRKVPHIGWNSIRHAKRHPIVDGVADNELVYFVHSYHVRATHQEDVLHLTQYGYEFASAVQKGTIFGFQYHPEKSQGVGMQLFKNFIDTISLSSDVSSTRYPVSVITK